MTSAATVHYVDPSTGRTYPLDEARWRADNGHYLDLSPGPGLTRREIEPGRRSVWRYARALGVGVEHAVSLARAGPRSSRGDGTTRPCASSSSS